MPGGQRKRFSEQLPPVMLTGKQMERIMIHVETRALSISAFVREVLDFYLEAHPLKREQESEESD
jgi:hypothetical protein